MELELSLARTRQLYLLVDIAASSLELKARGMVLDRAALRGAAIAAEQPLFGSREWPQLALPVTWRISAPPAVQWRRLVAPTELRPHHELTTREDAQLSPQPPAQPTPTPTPAAPATYVMVLDSGWELMVTDRLHPSRWQQLRETLIDGARRWHGAAPVTRPPRLVLAMEKDDARRLLHVFRTEVAILVVAGAVGHEAQRGG